MNDSPRFRLSPLEVAIGDAVGIDPAAPPLAPVSATLTPLSALEEAAVQALKRPPCLIAFSGGRDSSAVLAIATKAARTHGLELPIPITKRYVASPETDESRWQELVIRHLRLTEWEKVDIKGELDLLGPVARRLLTRHGLLWPPNFHSFAPLIERARGGSFMSGSEGDELFSGWRWLRAADVLSRRAPSSRRSVLQMGFAFSPKTVKRKVLARRWTVPAMPWLREEAAAHAIDLITRHLASEPVTWKRRVDWYSRQRWLSVSQHATDIIAREADVLLVDPLLDHRFLSVLAHEGARWGYGDRTKIMERLFGDLLPRSVIERRDKAIFTMAMWGSESRNFTQRWDGTGLDDSLVDVSRLRHAWDVEVPDARSASLLQEAWLRTELDGREDGIDDGVDEVPAPRS